MSHLKSYTFDNQYFTKNNKSILKNYIQNIQSFLSNYFILYPFKKNHQYNINKKKLLFALLNRPFCRQNSF